MPAGLGKERSGLLSGSCLAAVGAQGEAVLATSCNGHEVVAVGTRLARDAAERGNAIFARDYRTVTGAGHGSIEAEIIGNELPVKLRVWSDVPHVVILNHGAKPHEITPVNARFLQFGASYFAPDISAWASPSMAASESKSLSALR